MNSARETSWSFWGLEWLSVACFFVNIFETVCRRKILHNWPGAVFCDLEPTLPLVHPLRKKETSHTYHSCAFVRRDRWQVRWFPNTWSFTGISFEGAGVKCVDFRKHARTRLYHGKGLEWVFWFRRPIFLWMSRGTGQAASVLISKHPYSTAVPWGREVRKSV